MKTPRLIHRIRSVRARRRVARRLMPLERRRAKVRQRAWVSRWGTAALIAVGALALLAGLPWLVWRGPYVIDAMYLDRKGLADGSAALVTGLRTAVVAVVAALGAGIALLYTARTYRLTRRGQITERFTKALERLGSDQQYVRIGGILGLEQIVRDAPEQAATDAARVLGHFIRDRAPMAAAAQELLGEENRPTSTLPHELAADVQVALTALTRAESRTHVDPREVLDLHDLHLAGATLNQADLTEANLSGATLAGANLVGATLARANLREADLVRAYLPEATLTRADLHRAKLSGADLFGAKLNEVDLSDASINEVNAADANLSGANLSGAMLEGANLSDANLSGAELTWAKLHRAMLSGANLSDANLIEADLSEAMLSRADLSGATLTRADLRGADLSHVRVLTERLIEAQTDEETILPPEQQPAGP
ncbi:pentapeptide repeat-containing protein [Streptomyces sp. NPDC048581]|uniref:pentapeptide repeat-containing protein n=1 Tax=unclassified Streptomyces TaxID=2593676 RepID=UPI003712B97B